MVIVGMDTTNNKKRAATSVTTLLVQKAFRTCLTSNAIKLYFSLLDDLLLESLLSSG